MDHGKYIDFGCEVPNELWIMDTEGGKNVFRKEILHHLIAGDSDSAYFRIPDEVVDALGGNEDDIVTFSDNVADAVNKEFPLFLETAFNCPKNRNHSMNSEREVVSDKSFFLTKKRYIMHVVNNEGKKCDKMKIMGVELKKSSTPAITKKLLAELVDMILDGKTFGEVNRRMRGMKRDFMNADLFDIAKPSSVKTLTVAEEQYKMTGSYKNIAYQAKAAMMWNKNRTHLDEKISAGMKVGLIDINHPDMKTIAYPIDLHELPEWFLTYQINYEIMWKKVFKTMSNYMEANGWSEEKRREETNNKLGIVF